MRSPAVEGVATTRGRSIPVAGLVWLGRIALLVGGVTVAVLAGIVALLTLAAVTPTPALFMAAGVTTALAGWIVIQRTVVRRSETLRPWPVAALGAVLVVAAFGAMLVPLGDEPVPPVVPPGAGSWRLPDGGTVAFGVVRAADEAADAAPVIVLHGGPGVPDTAGLLDAFGHLAEAGHDVWAYDQRGAGRSSRLTDPSGYTHSLALADLERVIERIGSDRVILVGHSNGASLAAGYIAEHPGRVERAVFLSPGGLDDGGGSPQDRLTTAEQLRVYRLMVSPRALITYALVMVDPAAAHALADDPEVDARQDRVYARTLPALHCPGRTGPALHGLGFYANAVPWNHASGASLAAQLGHPRVPILVIKGQCDYLDWASATDYLEAFPDHRLLYLPGAGHDVHVDKPREVGDAVATFVDGRTVPGTLADPMSPPAGFQP
ncbi:alpha/beta hydrolase [Georgenia sp. H159]|uniref:alpha/beta hydrolase n=1 Tax=Georgenia sp. H159 TaxID=3076115 RepID=UPI002D76C2C4|nr:alpha/beta hydrolase [Georgenia sp. H159]